MAENIQESEGKRLNWRQACELLGCSKSQFYRLVNSGLLRGFRIGTSKRSLWVYEADCLALLNQIGS